AFLLRASKAAAFIGVWLGNPVTMPFFYCWSYKIGTMVLGAQDHFSCMADISFFDLFKGESDIIPDIIFRTLLGGVLLGVIPAFISYFVTLKLIILKKHGRRSQEA
ncbi:MAG: DUF2062 domain-containing protein, partial [Pseudomonadota bacterium]